MRLDGDLVALPDSEPLGDEQTIACVHHMLKDPPKLEEFSVEHEVDFSYSIPGLSRFRVNAFTQRGSVSLVIRAIPVNIRTIDDLALPPVIRELAEEERGIVLLTGTTGSGKSTTLAAMIDHINSTRARHIVTIEDPIEFLHPDKMSAINQREIGMDIGSFGKGLRRVLRQDPDVILIGEMRDEETVHTALSAAETGHLVFSTVHTVDAAETVNRLIDFFPPHMHQQVRAMIAGTLKGAISQRLVRHADGKGRVATCEILRMTGRVRDMIMDPAADRPARRGHRRGRLLRDADLRPGALRPPQGRAHHDGGGARAATSPHDFKLLRRRRRPPRHDDGRPRDREERAEAAGAGSQLR